MSGEFGDEFGYETPLSQYTVKSAEVIPSVCRCPLAIIGIHGNYCTKTARDQNRHPQVLRLDHELMTTTRLEASGAYFEIVTEAPSNTTLRGFDPAIKPGIFVTIIATNRRAKVIAVNAESREVSLLDKGRFPINQVRIDP